MTSDAAATFNPADISVEELEVDPYPYYAGLRRFAPIVNVPLFDEWFISRWDDAAEVMSRKDSIIAGRTADEEFFGAGSILRLEGDAHRSLREGIDTQLRPRAVRGYLEQTARPIVVDYVERIRDQGRADLTPDLFEKISVRVVGNQLGLGELDDDTLVRWFHVLSAGHGARDGAEADVVMEIDEYIQRKITTLTAQPDSSIISHMVHTGLGDRAPRTFEELMPTLRVIILGAFQEPGHAVANAVHGLFSRPDQLAELVADPQRLSAPAFNEGLRWIAPVGGVARTAGTDITIGDITIPAGASLTFVVSSVNRDESRFDKPDEYDMHRMMQPNASFGYGEHYCSGHAFARGLGQIVLEEVVTRLPGLAADPDDAPVVFGFGFRAATHLPAVWQS